MTQWIITRKCQYTETLCVEADSKFDAWEKSQQSEFERIEEAIIEEEFKEVK